MLFLSSEGVDLAVEDLKYYDYNFTRLDAKNCFVELVDRPLGIGKMLFRFVKYDPAQGNRQEFTLDFYLSVEEFLAMAESVKNGNLYKLIQQSKRESAPKPVYSKLAGYSPDKLGERKFPFQVPKGKSVSKSLEIKASTKSDYLITGIYRLGSERDNGLIVPEGAPLAYVQIPMSHGQFVGLMKYGELRIQAYEVVKMIVNRDRYEFD